MPRNLHKELETWDGYPEAWRPKPGERIGLKYLGKDQDKRYHRYHLIVDRPAELDALTPLGGEAVEDAPDLEEADDIPF